MKQNKFTEIVRTMAEMDDMPSNAASKNTRGYVVVIFNNIDQGMSLLIPVVLTAEEKNEYAARGLLDLEKCYGKERVSHLLKHQKKLLQVYSIFMQATFNTGSVPFDVKLPPLAKEMIATLGSVNCIVDLRNRSSKAIVLSDAECDIYLDHVYIHVLKKDIDEEKDEGSCYDVGYCREQIATFLLPMKCRRKILKIRIGTSDKRITKDLALAELENSKDYTGSYDPTCHKNIPVRQRVWENCQSASHAYIEDEDSSKDASCRLETTLLVYAHHLCATYPVESSFIVDLTTETGRVEFEFTRHWPRLTSRNKWTHIDHFDMSGDFKWYSRPKAATLLLAKA